MNTRLHIRGRGESEASDTIELDATAAEAAEIAALPDGPGKALKLTVRPIRDHVPVYLAAVGPKNLELAGEIADGWLAIFFSPEHSADLVASVETGARRAGRGTAEAPLAGFDIAPSVPVCIADDVEAAAAAVRASGGGETPNTRP